MKDPFNSEIQERKIMSKKISKYITVFDYFDKTLIALPATCGGISIISFVSVIGAPVGTASASFSLIFFDYRNGKKIIKNNKKKIET